MNRINDGYANVVANLGTSRDKAASGFYFVETLTPSQLLDMYRSSWIAAAVVDYPAEDAVSKWRYWRASKEQIVKIEALERKLRLKKRVKEALVAARLYGGAAIYINTRANDPASPLVPSEEVISLTVLTPDILKAGPKDDDIDSEGFGRPSRYNLEAKGRKVDIHPSRLVEFFGADVPGNAFSAPTSWGGDSVLVKTLSSIRQTDSTMANIASLVFEAKVDVFKFEGFAQLMASNQDASVLRRLHLQAAQKSVNGSVVIDAKDEYEQKNASFGGLPDLMTKFMDAMSGAARIPVTRLFGRAAAGLSGSGDGDERVYFDRISDMQNSEIGPEMALLDDCIIHNALGSRPPEIYYEWSPLRVMTQSERADIFSKTATAARTLAGPNAGPVVPLDALSESIVNELTEQGVLPGLSQSVERFGSLSEQDDLIEPPEDATL